VVAAIEAAAADANRKAIRLKGRELTDELKRISRTKHRGGKYPNLHDVLPEYSVERTLRGKRRQKENRALTELAQQHTPLALGEHEPLPDSFWEHGEERCVTNLLNAITIEAKESTTANAAAKGAMYTDDTAAAYAVTRLPACYAALHKVLLEVQRSAPRGWVPENVLDFGAGPGTATWAAHSIWSSSVESENRPLQVTAVEPSRAMTWLGQDIQQRLENAYQKQQQATVTSLEAYEAADKEKSSTLEEESTTIAADVKEPLLSPPPMVRWMSRLSGATLRGQRHGKEKKAPVLSGFPSASKKYDLVIAGYVLSEIPTPKDRRKLIADLWNRTSKYLILVEPGTPVGSDMIQSARSQILGLESFSSSSSMSLRPSSSHSHTVPQQQKEYFKAEAHVIAPCPHDGPCPLQQGRASWCHFVQRFERTAVQRRAKMVPGKLPPRSHQDERFSYVVLKRGSRDGSFFIHNDDEDKEESMDVFKDQVHVSGSFEGEEKKSRDANDDFLFIPENLKPKRILLQEGSEEEEAFEESDDDEDSLFATEIELRRLLLDSLDNENSDDEHSDSEEERKNNELPPELEKVLWRSVEELRNNLNNKRNKHSKDERHGSVSEENTATKENEDVQVYMSTVFGEEKKDVCRKGLSGPEAEEATRRSSSAWSRVLRPPRKRSGHVVLDLCSAVGVDGEPLRDTIESDSDSGGGGGGGGGRRRGVLLRQIVSKGKSNREIGGIAPFKVARRAAWGDLWPLDYQKKMRAIEPPHGDDDDDKD
jgi:ribosomal protein RSM22 (predicted rRNA methylase)